MLESFLFRGTVLLVNDGDGHLIKLDHGAFGDLDDDGVFPDVVDEAVDAGAGDDLIARLESGDACGLFLALFLLRTDEQEVEHDHHEDHHDCGMTQGA